MIFNSIKKSDFLKKLLTYFNGAVIAKFVGFLTFLYLGKLLVPEKYASFTLFIFAVEILSICTKFGLSSSMLRIIGEDNEKILTNSLLIVIILCLLTTPLVVFGSGRVIQLLGENYSFLSQYKYYICIRIMTSSVLNIISSYYIAIEKPLKFVKVTIISAILTLSILFILVQFFRNESEILKIILSAYVISGVISALFALFIAKDNYALRSISLAKSIEIVKYSWVFFIKNFIGILQMYASRIILSLLATSYLLGVYSFYHTFFTQANMLMAVFSQTFIPKIRNMIIQKNREKFDHARYLVRKTFKVYLIASSIMFVLAAPLLFLIIQNSALFSTIIKIEYLNNLYLFYGMLFAFFLGQIRTFFDVWQYVKNKSVNKHIIISNIFILLMLYFGNIYFFNLLGIYGIVLTQVLCYVLVYFSIDYIGCQISQFYWQAYQKPLWEELFWGASDWQSWKYK